MWNYGPNASDAVGAAVWDRLQAARFNIWGASAFKGASSPTAVWTPMPLHYSNHTSWVRRASITPLQGMVVTGWSRFNHTAALCEVLPVAIPSLVLCLTLLRHKNPPPDLIRRVFDHLGVHTDLMNPTLQSLLEVPTPSFPGAEAFVALAAVESTHRQLARLQDNVKLFCPPHTFQLNRPLWRQLETSARAISNLAKSLVDSVAMALKGVLKPMAVEEVVYSKVLEVDVRRVVSPCVGGRACVCCARRGGGVTHAPRRIRQRQAKAVAQTVSALSENYRPGSGHFAHRVNPHVLAGAAMLPPSLSAPPAAAAPLLPVGTLATTVADSTVPPGAVTVVQGAAPPLSPVNDLNLQGAPVPALPATIAAAVPPGSPPSALAVALPPMASPAPLAVTGVTVTAAAATAAAAVSSPHDVDAAGNDGDDALPSVLFPHAVHDNNMTEPA